MSEQVNNPVPKEVTLSSAELARSFLGHQRAEISRRIEGVKAMIAYDLDFSKHDEDIQWDISDSEYYSEMDRRDLEKLQNGLLINSREFEKVEKGDNKLIDRYSQKEKIRRAELEEQRKSKK